MSSDAEFMAHETSIIIEFIIQSKQMPQLMLDHRQQIDMLLCLTRFRFPFRTAKFKLFVLIRSRIQFPQAIGFTPMVLTFNLDKISRLADKPPISYRG